jgi:hypothetical protein
MPTRTLRPLPVPVAQTPDFFQFKGLPATAFARFEFLFMSQREIRTRL